jgi:hypothetical protein
MKMAQGVTSLPERRIAQRRWKTGTGRREMAMFGGSAAGGRLRDAMWLNGSSWEVGGEGMCGKLQPIGLHGPWAR